MGIISLRIDLATVSAVPCSADTDLGWRKLWRGFPKRRLDIHGIKKDGKVYLF
jgi:hypothetical protein